MPAVVTASQVSTSGFHLMGLAQQYGNYLTADVASVLLYLEGMVVTLSQYAFVFLVILGVFLYYTRLNKRLGKELLEGGVIIGLFVTFGVPYLATVAAAC